MIAKECRPPAQKILIGGESTTSRLGLERLLEDVPGLIVAGNAANAADLIRQVRQLKPDVLILETSLLRTLLRGAKASDEFPRMVSLSHHRLDYSHHERRWLCGYISEFDTEARLREVLGTIASCPQPRVDPIACRRCSVRRTSTPPPLPLSAREHELLVLIGSGLRSTEAAETMGVSVKTIESHRASIKRKLGLSDAAALNTAAVLWCERNGSKV